ncbi:hypothetical protein [Nocardia carnea]|uniref:hypothetical protein n=1 Tax=Nocardia carnea TaxID=37328 RepID=UPI0024589021|nr:hypothetical protein [Nocardia carnea]
MITQLSTALALAGQATCTHSGDEIVIEIDAPVVYAQPGYRPGEQQQIRYRTMIVDSAQGALAGAGEWETGRAGDTEPAEMDGTETDVLRNDPNAYLVAQEVQWLAPDGENPVASTELYATGYLIKDGRTELGVLDSWQ